MSDLSRQGFDPLGLLRAGWKRVLGATVAGAVVAATYALLAPPWYQAQLSVVPSPQQKSGLPTLGGAGIAAQLDLPVDFNLGSSEVERIAAVLYSNSVADAVIKKFDLKRLYDEKYTEEARRELWRHCGIVPQKKPGTVTVLCEDKSPERARDMAAYFGDFGNQVFRRISASSAREERLFLEKRVAEARRDMDEAALRLREFQEQNKVIDLTEQGRAVVSAMASIRAELLSKQMQLSFQNSISSRDEGTSDQLRRQVGILESKLHSLEEDSRRITPVEPASAPAPAAGKKGRTASKGDGARVFPAAMDMPKLRYELERRFREQKIQETLFVLLTQRFETARVNEARDTSTFQILDLPTTPTKKARPKRMMITASGLALGLLAGLAWILGPPWLRLRLGRRDERPTEVSSPEGDKDRAA